MRPSVVGLSAKKNNDINTPASATKKDGTKSPGRTQDERAIALQKKVWEELKDGLTDLQVEAMRNTVLRREVQEKR